MRKITEDHASESWAGEGGGSGPGARRAGERFAPGPLQSGRFGDLEAVRADVGHLVASAAKPRDQPTSRWDTGEVELLLELLDGRAPLAGKQAHCLLRFRCLHFNSPFLFFVQFSPLSPDGHFLLSSAAEGKRKRQEMTGVLGSAIVDGWRLETEIVKDADDQTAKIYYTAVRTDGRQVMVDWSPYAGISNTDFKRCVLLGFPTRAAVGSKGPLTHTDLAWLWWERFGPDPVWATDEPLLQQLLDEPIRPLSSVHVGGKSN